MSEQKTVNWGVSDDLQADVRFEETACHGDIMDLSIGCPIKCVYCIFSQLGPLVYKLRNPARTEQDVIPLKLDNFLKREEFPSGVLLGYNADPLGNDELTALTVIAVKKLVSHNTTINLVSKGVVTDALLEAITIRPELINVQAGITNYKDERNAIIEPGAPSYHARLESLKKLAAIDNIGSISVRIDPMMPYIDDTEENISHVLTDLASIGIKTVVIGYAVVTRAVRERLEQISYIRESAQTLVDKVQTISGQELFSFNYERKMEKLASFRQMCKQHNLHMKVCGCKDIRLRESSYDYICHPDQIQTTCREEEKQVNV